LCLSKDKRILNLLRSKKRKVFKNKYNSFFWAKKEKLLEVKK